ncbi:glutathione S-transferase family protein [Sphingomicrobium nitratireducens]|uniref:glutathione S-transferase family protein n=1 Tax=Sphingomicrobium nitratireducens TaxID=2964666 RepID=UPI00223FEB75|nr:glutathione binding-like protein [Sphingomicrobium nitratireducens]
MDPKLYFSPGACSLVSHIALAESGAKYETSKVDFAAKENRSEAYREIHPQGKVPALVTDKGTITENVAILGWIGDHYGKPGSVPVKDKHDRAKATELLGWCASTVHISFGMIFRPLRFAAGNKKAAQTAGQKRLSVHFARMEEMAAGDGWLVGKEFSAADSYFAVFFRWAKRIGADVSRYPNWAAHVERVIARKAVAKAIKDEGLELDEFRL